MQYGSAEYIHNKVETKNLNAISDKIKTASNLLKGKIQNEKV